MTLSLRAGRLASLAAGLCASILLVGCSPRQYFQQPAFVEESLDTLKIMRAEQSAMALKVSSLESQLRDQTARSAEREANLNAELTMLNESLERLSGQLENLGEQVQRRARPAPAPAWQPTPPPLPSGEPAPATNGAVPDSVIGAAGAPPSTWTPPPGNPGEIYDRAYRDVTRGNYELASQGFRDFLDRFPDDDLSDNAQYWLGECFYVQDQVSEAAREFEKVVNEHPRGDKVPAAYLKLGYCSLRKNDNAGARRWFDELIKKYPSTEEARSARNKLASIE
ncbi:MAG TPA: tol-pal system protein YbgF [Candidatus Eisenbacteria bacterium]